MHGVWHTAGIRFESDRFEAINGDLSEKILDSHGREMDKS